MKTIIIWSVFVLSVISSCQQADIEYYPIEKHHLGETYTSYTINNVMKSDSAGVVVFNFYPEEVTSLSYINYDEATCVFTFHRGETADYLISWDYETDGNYVEVQYGQNAMWYTVNEQKHTGEYLLRANDGMSVRMCMRSGGSMYIENGETFYQANVTVIKFSIEEAAEE